MLSFVSSLASALHTSGYPPDSPPVFQHPVRSFLLLGFVLMVKSLLLESGFLVVFFFTCQSSFVASPKDLLAPQLPGSPATVLLLSICGDLSSDSRCS